MVKLPEGFVLDSDRKNGGQSDLPEGFEIDKKKSQKQGVFDKGGIVNKASNVLAETRRVINKGVNSALFGLPELASRGGAELSNLVTGADTADQTVLNEFEPQTEIGKGFGVAADVAGLIAGGPGKVASRVGKRLIPRGANIGRRVVGGAVQGSVGGAVTPTEDFFDLKQRGKNVATGAVAGGALGGIIPTARVPNKVTKRDNVAGRVINSIIKPSKKQFAYGKNPGLAVAKEGIVANSIDDLAPKISQSLNNRTDQLTQILKSSNKKINISNFTKPIDDAMEEAAKGGPVNNALIQRLQDTKTALLNDFRVVNNNAQIVKPRNLENISPEEATTIKRLVGQLTKWTGTSDDNIVNSALKKSYSNVRSQIEKAVPATKEVNSRIANLISAESAITDRLAQSAKNNVFSLTDMISGLGGVGVFGSMTPGSLDSIIGAIATVGAKRALQSTAFKTRLASFLTNSSAKDKAKLFQKFPELPNLIRTTGILGSVKNQE